MTRTPADGSRRHPLPAGRWQLKEARRCTTIFIRRALASLPYRLAGDARLGVPAIPVKFSTIPNSHTPRGRAILASWASDSDSDQAQIYNQNQ